MAITGTRAPWAQLETPGTLYRTFGRSFCITCRHYVKPYGSGECGREPMVITSYRCARFQLDNEICILELDEEAFYGSPHPVDW